MKAVYTVILFGYDTPKDQFRQPGFDYILFTDDKSLKSDFWDVRYVKVPKGHKSYNRYIKLHPHIFLPEYELTIYIDGSTEIRKDISLLLSEFNGEMLVKRHPDRTCVYQEKDQVIKLGKADPEIVNKQVESYKKEGFPKNFGMWETGILIRANTHFVNTINEAWWAEMQKHSHRDQLSFPVVLWRMGYKPKTLIYEAVHRFIKVHKHKNKGDIKVWYSTPYCIHKNIGKSYNEFMETVPNNAWVCIRDGDTLFLTPENQWGKQIHDIIKEHGHEYDLIGCMTNRLRGQHQLVDGMFDEPDINKHIELAAKLHKEHYSEVVPANSVAGLCFIFRKELWEKVKFAESSIYFDTLFNRAVIAARGKVGVAKGLYLFHLYRWGQKDPKNYKEHLV